MKKSLKKIPPAFLTVGAERQEALIKKATLRREGKSTETIKKAAFMKLTVRDGVKAVRK